jgi:hypothetical protein
LEQAIGQDYDAAENAGVAAKFRHALARERGLGWAVMSTLRQSRHGLFTLDVETAPAVRRAVLRLGVHGGEHVGAHEVIEVETESHRRKTD